MFPRHPSVAVSSEDLEGSHKGTKTPPQMPDLDFHDLKKPFTPTQITVDPVNTPPQGGSPSILKPSGMRTPQKSVAFNTAQLNQDSRGVSPAVHHPSILMVPGQ